MKKALGLNLFYVTSFLFVAVALLLAPPSQAGTSGWRGCENVIHSEPLRACKNAGAPLPYCAPVTATNVFIVATADPTFYQCYYDHGGWYEHFSNVRSVCPADQVYNTTANVCVPATPPKCLGCVATGDRGVGNPVDAGTGNKYQQEEIIRSTDGAPALALSYNSQLITNVGFGPGWTFSPYSHLEIRSSTVIVRRLDGASISATCSTSTCTTDADASFRLTKDASGYTLTRDEGGSERYSDGGRIVAKIDRQGNTTAYAYEGFPGRLARVTGPFGHVLRFGYEGAASARIVNVTDPDNRVTTFGYDNHSNLIRISFPDGTAKHFHYENPSFVGNLTGTSYVDSLGNTTRYSTYVYNGSNKAMSTEHAGGMERFLLSFDTPTQTTVTDAANNSQMMTFQTTLGVPNLVSKVNSADNKSLTQVFDTRNNLTCKKDDEGRVTTYTYNSTNQKLSMTEGQSGTCAAPVTTSATRTTTYQYVSTTLDLPTVIESPSVFTGSFKRTEITYVGNLPDVITQRGYTPSGVAVIRVVDLGYNPKGQVTSIDGPRTDVNDVTLLAYNDCTTGVGCGQLSSITNAVGQITRFDSYDANGRVLQSTDPNGLRVTYSYDPRGRIQSVTHTPPTGSARVTTYTYTAAGDLASVVFPDNRSLAYIYDAARKLRTVTDNLGNQVRYNYDVKGNRTEDHTYDATGTLVRQLDLAYDARNHLETITAGGSTGSLTRQLHDALGNLASQTDPNANPATTHNHDVT